MKNTIIKLGLQTAGLGLALGVATTLSVYEDTIGYEPTREIKAEGRLESGEKYLIFDTIPSRRSAFNTDRHVHLGGLGSVRTSILENFYVQTHDVVGKDKKLVLPDNKYIDAGYRAPWYAGNAISNPELRAKMIDLANDALSNSGIKTSIKEGYPNIIEAIAKEKR